MPEIVPSNEAEESDPVPAAEDPRNSAEEPAREGGRHSRDESDERKPKKQRPFWIELPILILVAFVLAFVFQQFFAKVYTIPSGSMESTLHGCNGCYGDKILVDKIVYDFSDPTPGEVIVFKGPGPWTENDAPTQHSENAVARFFQTIGSVVGLAPPDERDFVKRVIAVGGQTVQCCDAQNRVIVDGKALDEPYIHWEEGQPPLQRPFEPVKVPEGSVWVMGDNRNNSCDSRCQGGGGERGVVPVDNVIGKARIIVLPPSRWGGVDDHDAQADAKPVVAAMGAPDWQQGLPLGFGLLAAWPTVAGGRRLTAIVRGTTKSKS